MNAVRTCTIVIQTRIVLTLLVHISVAVELVLPAMVTHVQTSTNALQEFTHVIKTQFVRTQLVPTRANVAMVLLEAVSSAQVNFEWMGK